MALRMRTLHCWRGPGDDPFGFIDCMTPEGFVSGAKFWIKRERSLVRWFLLSFWIEDLTLLPRSTMPQGRSTHLKFIESNDAVGGRRRRASAASPDSGSSAERRPGWRRWYGGGRVKCSARGPGLYADHRDSSRRHPKRLTARTMCHDCRQEASYEPLERISPSYRTYAFPLAVRATSNGALAGKLCRSWRWTWRAHCDCAEVRLRWCHRHGAAWPCRVGTPTGGFVQRGRAFHDLPAWWLTEERECDEDQEPWRGRHHRCLPRATPKLWVVFARDSQPCWWIPSRVFGEHSAIRAVREQQWRCHNFATRNCSNAVGIENGGPRWSGWLAWAGVYVCNRPSTSTTSGVL